MRKFEAPFRIDETVHSPGDVVLIIRDKHDAPLAYIYGSDRQTSDLLKLKVEEARGVARAIVLGLTRVSEERK